jgi:two-component system KDP operon response regulator KdpE
MKVLVIGGRDVVRNISFILQLRWPDAAIVSAAEGAKGMELVETEAPDLVMVDFPLPDMNGVDLAGKIRGFSDVPLIVLMGEATEMERARVLEEGADDYITRPFSPVDLLAKIRALLRRAHAVGFQRNHMPLVSGELMISSSTHDVFLSGEPVQLTPHEYELLLQLVRNEGRVLTHRALLEKVWGPEYVTDFGFLKKYIYRLRQKLHDDARKPKMILTERGVGYKFVKSA